MRAICFLIPSTRLAPPVRPAGCLSGGVTGFNEPNKTSQAFHEPLCRPGSRTTGLCHTAGVSSPAAHLRDPGGPGELPAGAVKGEAFPPPSPARPSHNHTLGRCQCCARGPPLTPGLAGTRTESQGRPELPHPRGGPQDQPVCLGLKQVTLNAPWQQPAPKSHFSEKLTARSGQLGLGTPGRSSYLGSNPGSHQKPRFSVTSSAGRGTETPASTSRTQAGSGLSATQRLQYRRACPGRGWVRGPHPPLRD